MRVALIIEHMDPSRGGRERSIAEVATSLARRHCRVTIFCQTACWSGEGVDVCALGGRGRLRVARLRNFVHDVQRALDGQRFDIVHATLPVPGANVYQLRSGTVPAQRAASLRRRSGLGRPGVWIGRSLSPCRRYLAKLERRLVARADVLCLAVSRMVEQELRTYYGRRDGIRVVYNAVELRDSGQADADQRRQLRTQLGLDPHDRLLLTVATNFELKGVAETLRAFARWRAARAAAPVARLALIGRERPAAYAQLAQRLGVDHLVTFVPPVKQIHCWHAAADICVLLSWYDPCSRVVLEATRLGVPSITTIHNGAAETLRRGAGIVVDSPRNIEAVAAAMARLADRQQHRTFSQACLRVAGDLSTEHHVDQLLEAYAGILPSRRFSGASRFHVVPTPDPSRPLREKPPATAGSAAGPRKKAA